MTGERVEGTEDHVRQAIEILGAWRAAYPKTPLSRSIQCLVHEYLSERARREASDSLAKASRRMLKTFEHDIANPGSPIDRLRKALKAYDAQRGKP